MIFRLFGKIFIEKFFFMRTEQVGENTRVCVIYIYDCVCVSGKIKKINDASTGCKGEIELNSNGNYSMSLLFRVITHDLPLRKVKGKC